MESLDSFLRNNPQFAKDKHLLATQKKLARLQAFTEFNPRPVLEVDTKGRILDINASAKEFFPGLKKQGIKHPYLQGFLPIVAKLKKGSGPFRREIKIGDKWFKQIFYYVPDFKLVHIYSSHVTERKEAEEALKKSELRYRSLFNKMGEGYASYEVLFNKQGQPCDYRFIDFNPAFEKITGSKRSDLLNKTASKLLPPEQMRQMELYGRIVVTGKPAHFELHSEPTKRHFEIFAYKVSDKEVATLILDITDRKNLEKQKDNFISIMSHELRNPLTPILASSQSLLSSIDARLNAKDVEEEIRIIERQSKSMARILDDLLDTARLSYGKIQLKKEVVNITNAIAYSSETVAPLIREQKQTLHISVPKKPIFVQADPVRLEQVIVNLMTNASKYTKAGGSIWVTAKRSGKCISITVKDNGVGIKPDKMKHIFTLFNQSDVTPLAPLGSLGIGLNITKQLVNMHQGTINVKSMGPNRGAEFIVRLPISKPSVRQQRRPQPIKSATEKHGRILITEDNPTISNILAKILTNNGYSVKTATNGNDALKLCASFKPDVALIDIGLPTMSGYEVAKEINKKKLKRPILLIAMTGYGQEKDKALAKEAGFAHHLTKPIDLENLLHIIHSKNNP